MLSIKKIGPLSLELLHEKLSASKISTINLVLSMRSEIHTHTNQRVASSTFFVTHCSTLLSLSTAATTTKTTTKEEDLWIRCERVRVCVHVEIFQFKDKIMIVVPAHILTLRYSVRKN